MAEVGGWNAGLGAVLDVEGSLGGGMDMAGIFGTGRATGGIIALLGPSPPAFFIFAPANAAAIPMGPPPPLGMPPPGFEPPPPL